MTAFLPYAEAHEGLGVPPPSGSHAAVFLTELNNRVPEDTEDVVALGDEWALEASAAAAAQSAIDNAIQRSDDENDGGTVAAIDYHCNFRWF